MKRDAEIYHISEYHVFNDKVCFNEHLVQKNTYRRVMRVSYLYK